MRTRDLHKKYPNGTPLLAGLYEGRKPGRCALCEEPLPKGASRLCSDPCREEMQRLYRAAWRAATRLVKRAVRTMEAGPS